MRMDLVFAYIAGLLTLINPCILPVLPIVLVAALNADRRGPLALAAGMSLSFVVFGVLVTAFGAAVGLTQDRLAQTGAAMMVAFGLILLVPAFSRRFEVAAAPCFVSLRGADHDLVCGLGQPLGEVG